MSRVDSWGRVILSSSDLFEAAYRGHDIWSLSCDVDDVIQTFNQHCDAFAKETSISPAAEMLATPEEEHRRRADTWLVPQRYREIDVRNFALQLCSTDEEIDRVVEEMSAFEARGLTPLLQTMIYLVDDLRSRKIVWGVGRGSSVASYVLFLIGVHKIDPLLYGLDFRDFLR